MILLFGTEYKEPLCRNAKSLAGFCVEIIQIDYKDWQIIQGYYAWQTSIPRLNYNHSSKSLEDSHSYLIQN